LNINGQLGLSSASRRQLSRAPRRRGAVDIGCLGDDGRLGERDGERRAQHVAEELERRARAVSPIQRDMRPIAAKTAALGERRLVAGDMMTSSLPSPARDRRETASRDRGRRAPRGLRRLARHRRRVGAAVEDDGAGRGGRR